MSGDPTVPPSPARLARAHRAGLRLPMHTWVLAGTALAFVWAAAAICGGVRVWARGWWAASFDGAIPDLSVAAPLDALASPAVLALAATVTIGLVARNLGPVDRRARAQLGARPIRDGGFVPVLLSIASVGVAGALLLGALAGAARAPAASGEGLLDLWIAWGVRAGWVLAGVALVLGWALRRRAAARLRRALFQTVEQARADARGAGRRAR